MKTLFKIAHVCCGQCAKIPYVNIHCFESMADLAVMWGGGKPPSLTFSLPLPPRVSGGAPSGSAKRIMVHFRHNFAYPSPLIHHCYD